MSRFICSPALKDDAKDCERETCEDADADGGGAEEENGPEVIGEHFGSWYGLMEGIGGILLFGQVCSTGGVV